MVKNLVSVRILAPLVQVWAPKFFPWILLLLDVRHYCKLSMHATKRKTYESNLRNWQKKKTRFRRVFGPFDPNLGR